MNATSPLPILVFVGAGSVGKSTLGALVAKAFGIPFFDVDDEMEDLRSAIGSFVVGAEYRRQIIENLLTAPPAVIATGFEDFHPDIAHHQILGGAVSIHLTAKTTGRECRTIPMLTNYWTMSPTEIAALYARADITIDLDDLPVEQAFERIDEALRGYLKRN